MSESNEKQGPEASKVGLWVGMVLRIFFLVGVDPAAHRTEDASAVISALVASLIAFLLRNE